MATIEPIEYSADERVADFRDLASADRRPDRPGGRGLVIAEGEVVVQRLLRSPYPVRAVLGTQRRIASLRPDLAAVAVPAYQASAEVMAEVVGFHLNRGVLATADRAPVRDLDALLRGSTTVAVLEGINDHENLGAIFRNAAALGVDAVLLGPGCSDPLYRRSVRVSMGHVLLVDFRHLDDWDHALRALAGHGFQRVALTPGEDAEPLPGTPPVTGKCALLLGAEGPGLSRRALQEADRRVRIPMTGVVDSLNVAAAAAIAFHALAGRADRIAAGTPCGQEQS